MLNVAVIGLGTMGNVHVEAWSRISDVNVAAGVGTGPRKN